MAALENGTPQPIVDNAGDCSDQVLHGARVASIGCGSWIRPHDRLDEHADPAMVAEVMLAVNDALQNRNVRKPTCLQWQTKITQGIVKDGVPVAVDTLRRLVAAAVVAKFEWSEVWGS